MEGKEEKGTGRTVAATLLETVMDGPNLVFGDVIEDVEMLLFSFGKGCIQLIGNHFISTTLKWKQFSLNVDGVNCAVYF